MTLGERIRLYRTQKGWTQKQLSDVSKVRQALISELESGHKQWTSAEMILRLARAFQVTVEQLMEGEQYEERQPAAEGLGVSQGLCSGDADTTSARESIHG